MWLFLGYLLDLCHSLLVRLLVFNYNVLLDERKAGHLFTLSQQILHSWICLC